jgi:DNA-directed RNA polymerase specialized sigma24 family protein
MAVATRPGGALPFTTGRMADLPDDATAVTRAVARDEGLLRLVEDVRALPDDDRRLVLLRGLEGRSHEEVAVLFATTPDAIAKRWQRLCARLRDRPRFAELVVA